MARPGADKTALLDAMAAHVLAHGLTTASLRPLARSAGTSDRMLIYHFGSKDRLVAALVDHLAVRMTRDLDAVLPSDRFASVGDCLCSLVGLMRHPDFAGFAGVWLDIVAEARHGAAAHSAAGARVIDAFIDWIAARLPEGLPDGAGTARLVLTLIEGTLVLDAVGQDAASDAAVAALAALADAPSG
jgi:AcrR family transcriptional regulator